MNISKNKNKFRADLGLWQACALVIGSMIGTGIFFFVSPVAIYLNHPLLILSAWTVGGGIAFCGALCLAELAATYPETGGVYVYFRRAFGPYISFLYTWTKFLVMRVGSLAIPALAFSGFFADFFSLSPTASIEIKKPLSAAVIILLTVFNAMGVRFSGHIQSILTILKVSCLIFIIVSAALLAMGIMTPQPIGSNHQMLGHITTSYGASSSFTLSFMAALVPILWTLGGWDEPPFVAEEITNPQRNLPLSILIGTMVVIVLYVCVNAAYLWILTPSEIAASGESTAVLAMGRVLGPQSSKLIGLFLMISCLGVLNVMILTGARIAFAAGHDHLFFRWFKQLEPLTQTPQRGLFVQGALAIFTIIFSDDILTILLYTGMPYWFFSILMVISLFVLRRRDNSRIRPFRTWAYPVVPIIFMIFSIIMVIAIAFENPKHFLVTGAILGFGSIAYFCQTLLSSPHKLASRLHLFSNRLK